MIDRRVARIVLGLSCLLSFDALAHGIQFLEADVRPFLIGVGAIWVIVNAIGAFSLRISWFYRLGIAVLLTPVSVALFYAVLEILNFVLPRGPGELTWPLIAFISMWLPAIALIVIGTRQRNSYRAWVTEAHAASEMHGKHANDV